MKTLNPLKVPFSKAKFSRLRNVRCLQWEDAFEVDFDDGLSFLEPHRTIRKANKIASRWAIWDNRGLPAKRLATSATDDVNSVRRLIG